MGALKSEVCTPCTINEMRGSDRATFCDGQASKEILVPPWESSIHHISKVSMYFLICYYTALIS